MATLQYYKDLVGPQDREVVNSDQAAAVIKAHDEGVSNLKKEEIALVDQALSRIKASIK